MWTCLVVGAIGLAVIWEFVTAPSLWQAWWQVRDWFSPFNIWNLIATAIATSPAVLALWIAQGLERWKRLH